MLSALSPISQVLFHLYACSILCGYILQGAGLGHREDGGKQVGGRDQGRTQHQIRADAIAHHQDATHQAADDRQPQPVDVRCPQELERVGDADPGQKADDGDIDISQSHIQGREHQQERQLCEEVEEQDGQYRRTQAYAGGRGCIRV